MFWNILSENFGFASEVGLQDRFILFGVFICFVHFVDRFYLSKRTIHELHKTH